MTSRQIGHMFFEPRGYDELNKATHEYREGHAVGIDELKVGDGAAHLVGKRDSIREALAVELGEAHEAGPTALSDFFMRVVRAEEPVLAVLVERSAAPSANGR
jgi:hypothetical protein